MHAMQYEITLPADYDMAIIRRRVATKGAMTDDFDGLGLKAYAMRERGVDGSSVNQYAPFYVWVSTNGMNSFLWGGPFGGLSRDFGRPVVQQWTGLAFERGPAYASTPRAATRRAQRLGPDADPSAVIDAALSDTRERACADGVHSTALAIDTRAWEVVQFALHEAAQPGRPWDPSAPVAEATYRVLHLSSPHIEDVEVGSW